MTTIIIFLVVVFGAALALAIGGGLLTLLAYGTGWIINHIMGLESFQATALSLAGLFVFIFLVDRVSQALRPYGSIDSNDDDDDYDEDDEDDEDYEDYDYDDDSFQDNDEEKLNKLYAGIPRWRRPNRTLDFSKTKPDDRCPCGSGRKYKNCHGVKPKK